MAKFKCRNCDNEFEYFCDKAEDSKNVQCPSCLSHWVEIKYEKKKEFNPFTPGQYIDPIYPLPEIIPWNNAPRYWCFFNN
jgi:DNA-directed RNA polymerase subunit RPC12/RpoP